MKIIRRLESLRAREHSATVELIATLCECHRTRAFADAGYGSVWQLLVRRLHYSPAAASRRNAAMRCALQFPVVLDMLREHRTTLSALHKIEKTLLSSTEPQAVLRSLDGATQAQVEEIVAATRPAPKPIERIQRKAVARKRPTSCATAQLDLQTSAAEPERRVQLTFSLSKKDFAKLERVKSKLSNKLPAGMTLEQVFNELMDQFLKEPAPRAMPAKPTKRTRHIPAATRREVMARDQNRCTFTAPDGTTCSSTHDLEIDHVVPFADGGTHDPANLRVLCRAHNQRRAEVAFGGVPQRNTRPAGP